MNFGKRNIAIGLLFMATFMIYGFGLIYMRDFYPSKIDWIEHANNGTHFEAKLAHVHGNLFSLLNILLGFLLIFLKIEDKQAKIISSALLTGMLMPLGIISEFLFGVPPVLVLVGAISMVFGVSYFGVILIKRNGSN